MTLVQFIYFSVKAACAPRFSTLHADAKHRELGIFLFAFARPYSPDMLSGGTLR